MSKHKGNHQSSSDDQSGALYWLKRLLAVLGVGLIGVIAFALARSPSWSALGVAVVTAVGAFLVGILLGLLYGMPVGKSAPSAERTPPELSNSPATSNSSQAEGADSPVSSSASQAESSPFQPSTRLQEVADWLTKIIIGLGLVEMGRISSKVWALAQLVGLGLGGSSSSNAFALAILICSFVGGFLFGFIWSDVFLPGMLSAVYFRNLREKVINLEGNLKQLRAYIEKSDLNALRLSEQWLSQPPNASKSESESELKAAIRIASPTARSIVFNQAYELDRPNWKREERMNRRVLIYQALVEQDQDKGGKFHRNRGQLGIALATCVPSIGNNKDSDCQRAIELLTNAIDIRKEGQYQGWRNYEFYRAYAGIMHSQKRDIEVQAIKTDLDQALRDDRLLQDRVKIVKWHKNGGSDSEEPEPRDEYTSRDINKVRDWLELQKDQVRLHQWKPQSYHKGAAA